jgi:hypothetical protein
MDRVLGLKMESFFRKIINKSLNYIKMGKPVLAPLNEDSRLIILLKNLNLIDKIGLDFTENIEKYNTSNRYYLSIKVKQIESLSEESAIITSKLLDIYHKYDKIHLIFDLSTEAITYTGYTSQVLLAFHQLLQKNKINNKRVTLLCANANANQAYITWYKENNIIDYQINVLGYHFYLYEYFWEIKHCNWIQKNKNWLINYSQKTVKKGQLRAKYFLCLNLRPRSHRTAILLHLLERGHFAKGHVTYFGDDFADHDSVDQQQQRVDFISKLQSSNRLLPYLTQLDKMAPIMLDKDPAQMRQDLWHRKPGQVDFLIPEGDQLTREGISTYFEIVTETWFTNKDNLYITEKTIRPLVRLQPFIHVGSPHLLKQLHALGFQTFSPYIDESYDSIDDPYLRLEAIFNEIDRLCNMSIQEIHDIYCKLWPRVKHNYMHFNKNTLKIAESDIKKNIIKELP